MGASRRALDRGGVSRKGWGYPLDTSLTMHRLLIGRSKLYKRERPARERHPSLVERRDVIVRKRRRAIFLLLFEKRRKVSMSWVVGGVSSGDWVSSHLVCFSEKMPITRSGEAILENVNKVILKLEAERARLFFKHERTRKPSEAVMGSIHAMILRVKKAKGAFQKEVWEGRNDVLMWKTRAALEEELVKVEENMWG